MNWQDLRIHKRLILHPLIIERGYAMISEIDGKLS